MRENISFRSPKTQDVVKTDDKNVRTVFGEILTSNYFSELRSSWVGSVMVIELSSLSKSIGSVELVSVGSVVGCTT